MPLNFKNNQIVYFVAVSIVGLFIDLLTAFTLLSITNLSLILVATIAFAVAAFVNYVLHENLSFNPTQKLGFSLSRLLGYLVSCAVVLTVRMVFLMVFAWFTQGTFEFVILFAACGFSLLVNFFVSRKFVFGTKLLESQK